MQETHAFRQRPATPKTGAVEPSATGNKPYVNNPVGFDFVIGEIAERNPIVRSALLRRGQGWTG